MGMESFFIRLLPKGIKRVIDESQPFDTFRYVGETNLSTDEFAEILTSLGETCIHRGNGSYELNNSIILSLQSNNDDVKEIALEGCLSWYDDCINEMYRLTELINTHILEISLNYPEVSEGIPARSEFATLVQQGTEIKYRAFLERYGSIQIKILPGKHFYEFVRNPFKRLLFKWFRNK